MKKFALLALIATAAFAESKYGMAIHSSDDYLLADELADEEFYSQTMLAPPTDSFWDKVGAARAESYEMELEFDDRAAPVSGVAFHASEAPEVTDRGVAIKTPDVEFVAVPVPVKVVKPSIWDVM